MTPLSKIANTNDPAEPTRTEPDSVRIRWANLTGREHGDPNPTGPAFVLLHGLTFDRRMWYPVLDVLPGNHRAIAFDLPGHGGSPALSRRGLAAVVDAIHEAVLDAGLVAPVMVGHSIGGPLASIYAANHPASGVVSIEAPIRLEPFAEFLHSLAPQLAGDDFGKAWAPLQDSWRMDLLTAPQRELLRAGRHAKQRLVLSYQSDLLERPLAEVVRWRDDGLRQLRSSQTPYVSLHATPVEPEDHVFLAERLPQADIAVWPVGHHFPHLAEPERFARLLTTTRWAR
jgi:pimeloyl-ACP methyl ester carboxylesterase